MEIRFSDRYYLPILRAWGTEGAPNRCYQKISDTVHHAVGKPPDSVFADSTNVRGHTARFKLLSIVDRAAANTEQHDRVIRALLTLDPDATIRTARAVYEGLASFEAQLKARVCHEVAAYRNVEA